MLYKSACAGLTKKKGTDRRDSPGSWLLLPFPRHDRRGAVFDCLFDFYNDITAAFAPDFSIVAALQDGLNSLDRLLVHYLSLPSSAIFAIVAIARSWSRSPSNVSHIGSSSGYGFDKIASKNALSSGDKSDAILLRPFQKVFYHF